MQSGKRQPLSFRPTNLASFVPAILSVPLALAFGLAIPQYVLGIQADPTVAMVGIIGLGVLASLDIRSGFKRTMEAFAATLLFSAFVIDRSPIGQSLLPLPYGEWSFLFIALPPAIGVVLAGFLFARPSKYQMIMANLTGSIALTIGLVVGLSMRVTTSSDPSANLVLYTALGIAANMGQVGVFYILDKLWKSRRPYVMMPTAFFSYNIIGTIGLVMTGNIIALYPFISSLAILPALAIAGGSGSASMKTSTVPSTTTPRISSPPKVSTPQLRPIVSAKVPPPNIMVSGISSVQQQGKEFLVKILTESRGHMRNMRSIMATVLKPGGRKENLKLSRTSRGEYKAKFKPDASGNYTIQVGATSEEKQSAEKSVSFTAQSPPSPHSSPRSLPPAPQSRPSTSPVAIPVARPSPVTLPPIAPVSTTGRTGVPSLNSWDPRAWVSQEIHGYKIVEYLATGLSGYVLRAIFEHSGNEVAIKIPILKSGTGTTALDETMAEATRLLELSAQSKYLVQLRGILVDRFNVQEIAKGDAALYLKSPPAIVMELMKGGTAKKLIEDPSYDSVYYSEKWGGIVMLIGYMIAMGLETIHNAGFVHLDVKPQNLLFNLKPPATGREFKDQIRAGTLVPKLADLGSAVRIGGKVNQFTSEYASGEQVIGGTTATAAMDIYALGATLYTLLTKTPANSKKLIDAMNNVAQNSGKVNELKTVWNSFHPDVGRIAKFSSAVSTLEKMLSTDPQKRPTATSVANSLKNLGDMTVS